MNAIEPAAVIRRARGRYGRRLLILAHHYQADEVVAHADFVGDSLELARRAAREEEAEFIVLCGVHFMAETAAILSPGKKVYIPDPQAGCPLADSAPMDAVSRAWELIARGDRPITPITYVNSSARLKAFCGDHEGAVCTSANASRVVSWALQKPSVPFFVPDMNLGLNTARALGIDSGRVLLWDPGLPDGGISPGALGNADMVVWKGWCPVHYPSFTREDVERLKRMRPGIRVVMHPESSPDTVEASGEAGSTSQMLSIIDTLPQGSVLGLGTETTMVRRAARAMRGRVEIMPVREVFCEDMAKITVEKLADTLMGLETDKGRVQVPEEVAFLARKALDVMLRV